MKTLLLVEILLRNFMHKEECLNMVQVLVGQMIQENNPVNNPFIVDFFKDLLLTETLKDTDKDVIVRYFQFKEEKE